MVNIVLLKEAPPRVEVSPRGVEELRSEVSRKVVYCEVSTEVSEPAKDGTDEQKLHKRLYKPDEVAQQTEVPTCRNTGAYRVDAAGFIRRVFILPREVSNRAKRVGEVSRGHSSWSNELRKAERTHTQRRTER